MDALLKLIGAFVLIAVVCAGFAVLFAFPVKWLWNWLIPSIFHLRQINAWEAWGLMTLGGFLFKSSSPNSSKS